jgi:hypothetical protein
MRKSAWIMALVFVAITAPKARANEVTFNTVPGSDSDGSLAGMISFTAVSGGIDITVTNTETGTFAKGQAISDFSFTVQNGLSTPTAFTKLTGKSDYSASIGAGGTWTIASGTAFSNTPTVADPNAIDHWGFATSGKNVTVETAGSSVKGATGNPHYMILPSSGKAGPGKSLADGHFDPYIIGPANFFLSISGVTATTDLTDDFTGVKISFGTGPDKILGTNGTGAAPEPVTVLLLGTGLLFIFIMSRKALLAKPLQNRAL